MGMSGVQRWLRWKRLAERRMVSARDRVVLSAGMACVVRAITDGGDLMEAARQAAQTYGRDALSLSQVLDDLETACAVAHADPPSGALVRAGCEGWASGFVEEMGALSCADPLTGMGTVGHLRLRLAELYRAVALDGGSARPSQSHQLVAVWRRDPVHAVHEGEQVAQKLRAALLGAVLCSTLSGCDAVVTLGAHCVVALLPRADRVEAQVRLLPELLEAALAGATAHIEVVALPEHLDEAFALVQALPTRHRGPLMSTL